MTVASSEALQFSQDNMGRSRRAGCPIFTLWKATVCRGDLGGCDICRDSYQGQDIKCQAPLLFMHEKTVICHASKFTNMYENLIKCYTFVSPKRIKHHKHILCLGKLWCWQLGFANSAPASQSLFFFFFL